MPRHIIRRTSDPNHYGGVVRSLAKELTAGGGGAQPLILEHEASRSLARYVTVIWDRWKDVPEDLRPESIIAAYEQAEGPQYAETVMTAEGLTPAEANALGLLPFAVIPARGKTSKVPPDEYRKAIAEE